MAAIHARSHSFGPILRPSRVGPTESKESKRTQSCQNGSRLSGIAGEIRANEPNWRAHQIEKRANEPKYQALQDTASANEPNAERGAARIRRTRSAGARRRANGANEPNAVHGVAREPPNERRGRTIGLSVGTLHTT
jgi:hypothetical protein